ncbi:hypothetical protein [Egicoccus sp. AB-alg2]|uniref:hypothetical protein n=1 Tax=Egicoccus sp. AB-alg2 TaxID=3242693 RepID=UPI00359D32D5
MLLCEVAAELEDGARSRVDARPLRPDGARPVRRASGVVAVVDDDVLVRLVRRRLGWHRGLLDTLWSHRDAILRPRYRGMAFGGLGLFTAVEAVGPIIDALGLVALVAGLSLGLVHHEFALLYFALAYLWGITLSLGALALEDRATGSELRVRDRVWQVVAACSEPLWYRQLSLWWRLRGTWRWLRGGERTWGTMTRSGFTGSGR